MKYDFNKIEQRWQQHWEEHRTFRTPNPAEEDFVSDRPKFYVLDMFPYPSGVGLHVGHPLGYIATDIVARYKRMTGHNVLHPMGYDAFGLPAEQYAVENNIHPRITTEQNIANMSRQLKRLGLSYDWDREIATTDEDYYKWTQWIFLQIYNSWYDPASNKARPIGELVHMLQSDQMYLTTDGDLVPMPAQGLEGLEGPPVGVIQWQELSPQQQRDLIDSYRLAYKSEAPVNWCPALGTVLANEEITADGRSERGNHPVYRRPLSQWMLRITAYCERLLEDLDKVDWPEPIKLMQRNWIGRSRGAQVDFYLAGAMEASEPKEGPYPSEPPVITVFTTRPDTLFGATYMVLAPEHPLVAQVATPEQQPAIQAYCRQAANKAEVERQAETRQKTGVFTGGYAINPVNNEKIPIWIADYVLMGYGTGAIMAVPAHDERDFAFARQFGLPITPVVMPNDEWLQAQAKLSKDLPDDEAQDATRLREMYLADCSRFNAAYTGHGVSAGSVNDEVSLNGLSTPEAKAKIIPWLESKGVGKEMVQYKLRDWLFSRQRYWGEPFPILHGPDGEIRAVDFDDLPVVLPEMEDFKPRPSDDPDAPPEPPLGRAPESWRFVEIDGVRYERELNTMPQWAGSCWYYLRFCDPRNDERLIGKAAERYWMGKPRDADEDRSGGVDLYVGGAEHAVLHLLYARFWHKVLYDRGYVSTPEPFARLFNQGYIQAYAYTDERGAYVPAEEVVEKPDQPVEVMRREKNREGDFVQTARRTTFYYGQTPVVQEYGKMGKSLKNAVSPDEMCEQYGADTLRLYEMYMGPLEQSKPWNTRDIIGVHRFLQRVWRNYVAEDGSLNVVDGEVPDDMCRELHKTIRRVTEAMNNMSFNVAIAALIELNNQLVPREKLEREVAEDFVLLLAPLAPHMAEELWRRLEHNSSVALEDWPTYDEALLVENQVEYPVQVNGKLRGKIVVPTDADDEAVEEAALADAKVQASIGSATVRKVIVIQGRLVNIVAK